MANVLSNLWLPALCLCNSEVWDAQAKSKSGWKRFRLLPQEVQEAAVQQLVGREAATEGLECWVYMVGGS